MKDKILQFKNREIKAKEIFTVKPIDKITAFSFVREYHYLKDAKFFSKFNFGLYVDDSLVGVSVFSNPQGIVALKSWFGLGNNNQTVMELHRLCMLPILNG